MGRKKKGGGKRRGDDSDDDFGAPAADPNPAAEETTGPPTTQKLSRKQQRAQKAKQKQQQQQQKDDSDDDDDLAMLLGGGVKNKYGSDDDDDDSDDVPQQPAKKGGKGGRGGGRGGGGGGRGGGKKNAMAAAFDDDSSDEDDEDEEEEIMPQPVSKKDKKKKGKQAAMAAAFDSEDSDDDEEEEEEEIPQPVSKKDKKKKGKKAAADDESDDDEEVVQQVSMMILDDDDWGGEKKKKKKDKKEKKKKKEKKEKKEKKKKKDKDRGDNDDDNEESGSSGEQPAEKTPEGKKSKFQLQMEAAMKKKDDEEKEPEEEKVEEEKPEEEQQKEEQPKEEEEKPEEEEEENEVMYGAPDDVAWTDKSSAQVDAEKRAAEAGNDEKSLMYGPDGKKLSNKERKRLLKAKQAAERAAEFEAAAAQSSKEGAQFACSQTAVNEKDPQWENALDITIPNFSISAAGKILFKDAALTVAHGRRYGLVGPNGRGKSTLLKMIASKDLKLPPRIDFLYVEQEVQADDTPAVEAVLRADKRRWELLEEEKELMKKLDEGDESEETINRIQVVVDELTNMGSDSAEAKARRILYGLGFSMEMQTKPTKMFSGGWRMRISLARALFMEPTLLMLDEPTNHLDLNAVIWLDEYLQHWKKTLFVVSHDQDFLNSVCQEILHIEDLKLISYKGDYDTFKKGQRTKFEQQVKAWEKQEKRLRELKKSGQSKAKAQESMKKSASKREAGARSQKKKQANAIASGAEAAQETELIKRPKEYQVKLEFVEVAELSRPVMEVNRVHFRYSPKNPVIFDEIDFGIDMDSRICVVGPNGAGKSTLLKLLTGEIQATKGDVRRNPRLRMGVYNQHFVDRLPMGKTPVEHLRDRFNGETYQSVRNRLGKYGLEGHAHEVVMRDLSGGQKARVVFVELSLQEPHILLLDEPTNNLDIETIDALCDAINEFNGGIVVVTHDQRLIDECDCELWVVEKLGVTKWTEGFDDYKECILRELEEQVEKEAEVRRKKLEAASEARAEKIARLKSKVKKK